MFNKTLTQTITFIIICLSIFFVINCSHNGGTTTVTNPDISGSTSSITVGKLNADGTVQITIPLSLFGNSEDALNGASIDIYLNSIIRNAGIDPVPYYSSSYQAVMFMLSNINDGDMITIVIHTSTGTESSYSGIVSSEEETEAVSETASEDEPDTGTTTQPPADTSDSGLTYATFPNPNLEIYNYEDGSNSIEIDANVFGDVSHLDQASLSLRFIGRSSSLEETHTVNPADYYETSSNKIVIRPHDLWSIVLHYHPDDTETDDDPTDFEIIVFSITKTDGSQYTDEWKYLMFLEPMTNSNNKYFAFQGDSTESFYQYYYVKVELTGYSEGCDEESLPTEPYWYSEQIHAVNGKITPVYHRVDGYNMARLDSDGSFAGLSSLEIPGMTLMETYYGTITDESIISHYSMYTNIINEDYSYDTCTVYYTIEGSPVE